MQSLTLPLLIGFISMASVLIPMTPGILFWKSHHRNMRLLCWLLIASFFSDMLLLILFISKLNSWPIVNLFFLIQFCILFIVLNGYPKNRFLKTYFYACILFGFVDFFFIQTSRTLNSYTSYVWGITMIVSAIYFLYRLLS